MGGAGIDRQQQAELLRRVAEAQDRAAFAELFRHFAPRVKGYMLRQGAAEDVAEELAQESLITLWHRAVTFDPAQASVATWIFTIARNKRIDRIRREKRPELDPDDPALQPDPEPSPDAALDQMQDEERLRAALADLPAEQKRLLELAFFQDISHRDIAAAENLPLGTVKSRIRLALARLKGRLESD